MSGMTVCRTTEELRTALAAGLTADQIDVQPLTDMTEEQARALGFLDGQREACETAVLIERKRIVELLAMVSNPVFAAYADRAQAAIDSGISPGAFAMEVLAAERERLALDRRQIN